MPNRAVANDLGDVALAIDWADKCFEKEAVSSTLRSDIQVCLEEALANLILHGQSHDGEKDILVSVELRDKAAVVSIFDRCSPFDVAKVALPPAPTLQDAVAGGHGLRLLRMLSTHLSYRTDQDGNELRMVFETVPGPARSPACPAAGT